MDNVDIGSGKDVKPVRCQAFTGTNDDPVYWRTWQ